MDQSAPAAPRDKRRDLKLVAAYWLTILYFLLYHAWTSTDATVGAMFALVAFQVTGVCAVACVVYWKHDPTKAPIVIEPAAMVALAFGCVEMVAVTSACLYLTYSDSALV